MVQLLNMQRTFSRSVYVGVAGLLLVILLLSSKSLPELHQDLNRSPNPSSERVAILLEIAGQYDKQHSDSAVHYYREALQSAKEIEEPIQALNCHIPLARILLNQRLQLDSVVIHLEEGLAICEQYPKLLFERASLLRTKGEYLRQKGQLEEGIEALQEADQLIKRGLERRLSITERKTYLLKQVVILNTLGNIYKNQDNCTQSIELQHQILALAEEIDNREQMGYATYNLGACNFMLGNLPEALEYYLSSLSYTEHLSYKSNTITTVNLGVGAIYAEMGQYDSAKVYFKRALETGSTSQKARHAIGTYTNLGELEILLKQPDSAIHYFNKGVELARSSQRNPQLAYLLSRSANVLLQKGYAGLAFEQLLEAQELMENLQSPNGIASVQGEFAQYYLQTGKPRRAIEEGIQSLRFSQEHNMTENTRQLSLTLSQAYEQIGKPTEALSYYRMHIAIRDSLRNEDNVRKITQLDMQHTFDQQQQAQRLEQEKKDALVAAQFRTQAVQRNALIGGLIALLLIAGLLYRGYRNKRSTNLLLENKNQLIQTSLEEKEILLREIHHRVKNNLQVISSLLSLQSQHVSDKQIQDAIKEGRNRVSSMAMIHQNLYQTDNLTGIEIGEYIERLTQSLFDSYNISPDRIHLQTNIPSLQLDVDTVIPLGLILNELISNALKYAFPDDRNGQIEVQVQEAENQLQLTVADNGVGMPEDFSPQQASTMGYQLIQAFVAKLKGKLEILQEGGTTVRLRIAQYKTV